MRRCKTAAGLATVTEEFITDSGKPVIRCLLDSNGEERMFLRAFVEESKSPVPTQAKKMNRRIKVQNPSVPVQSAPVQRPTKKCVT
jgi:hypothetical protein